MKLETFIKINKVWGWIVYIALSLIVITDLYQGKFLGAAFAVTLLTFTLLTFYILMDRKAKQESNKLDLKINEEKARAILTVYSVYIADILKDESEKEYTWTELMDKFVQENDSLIQSK